MAVPGRALIPQESKRLFEAVLARASSGEACNTELDFRSGKGEVAPAHLSLRKMKSLKPTAICMVVTDLTERKRNDELIAAGRLATSILESAAEAIAVCDQEGRIVTANQALERLCGSNPLFQPFDLAIPLKVNDGVKVNDGAAQPPGYFSVAGTLYGATSIALSLLSYPEPHCVPPGTPSHLRRISDRPPGEAQVVPPVRAVIWRVRTAGKARRGGSG